MLEHIQKRLRTSCAGTPHRAWPTRGSIAETLDTVLLLLLSCCLSPRHHPQRPTPTFNPCFPGRAKATAESVPQSSARALRTPPTCPRWPGKRRIRKCSSNARRPLRGRMLSEDDDRNLVRSITDRTIKLLEVAEHCWPVLKDKSKTPALTAACCTARGPERRIGRRPASESGSFQTFQDERPGVVCVGA